MTKPQRIVAVTSDVPFVEGGHLTIARGTIKALKECGYETDLVLTPSNRLGRLFQAYLATRLTDVEQDGLGRRIHQVISFRYPSYAVKHPFHVCWLTHRPREYYDLWDSVQIILHIQNYTSKAEKMGKHQSRSSLSASSPKSLQNRIISKFYILCFQT